MMFQKQERGALRAPPASRDFRQRTSHIVVESVAEAPEAIERGEVTYVVTDGLRGRCVPGRPLRCPHVDEHEAWRVRPEAIVAAAVSPQSHQWFRQGSRVRALGR